MSDEKDFSKAFIAGAMCVAAGFILERSISACNMSNVSKALTLGCNTVRVVKELAAPTIISEGGEPLAPAISPFEYTPADKVPKNPPPPMYENIDPHPQGNGVYAQSYQEHMAMEELKARQRETGSSLLGKPDFGGWGL